MENLITVISAEEFKKLITDEKLIESTYNSNVSTQLKTDLIEYFKQLTGLEDVGCIMCSYKIDSSTVQLNKHYSEIDEFLEVGSDAILLQFKAKNALMFTMDFEDFLSINSNYNGDIESYKHSQADNVIAFVPYINLKDSKYFISLDDNWDAVDIDVDSVIHKGLRRMDVC